MYRLFCNDRCLKANNFCEDLLSVDNKEIRNSDDIVYKILDWLYDESQPCLDLGNVDGKDLAYAIKTVFRQAPAAGGVVIIDNQFVAIERNGIPDLPKGHIEKGESPEVAALREVEEETGITDLEIINELPSTWHCYLLNNQWTIKKTSWFLMRTGSGMKNIPQTEEGISKVYLVDNNGIKDFEDETFASLKTLVPFILPVISSATK
ncbi:MAG: NUDIX domain-containing protein [Bacteroidales bacterium]|nr:NUDIX domain-containing protein [Bacteroidales bacterium]